MIQNTFKMDNLRNLRKKRHITQIKLSVDIEVSQELISQYELGKSFPNRINLNKLADYFNCSTDFLLNRTNNPNPIDNLNQNELDNLEILEKYNSLSKNKKEQLNDYLNYLSNK